MLKKIESPRVKGHQLYADEQEREERATIVGQPSKDFTMMSLSTLRGTQATVSFFLCHGCFYITLISK
jgi:hypothetical protein